MDSFYDRNSVLRKKVDVVLPSYWMSRVGLGSVLYASGKWEILFWIIDIVIYALLGYLGWWLYCYFYKETFDFKTRNLDGLASDEIYKKIQK